MTKQGFTIWFTGLSGVGKSLYKLADEGVIKNFTGVSDPYEAPEHPELILETNKETIEESIACIFRKLTELGYLEPEKVPSDGLNGVGEHAELGAPLLVE
jgi:adenylylsulfate kinase-like enzyme